VCVTAYKLQQQQCHFEQPPLASLWPPHTFQ
jgi:hypothetical protein